MKKLTDGIERFQREAYPRLESAFRALSTQQHPEVLLITCADSRIVPDLVLQTGPGDLFICRNAGNIVPPHRQDEGVAATVEYAVDVLRIKQIVVCGHSDCGAMKAVLHPESIRDKPTIASWLRHADRARRLTLDRGGDRSEEARLRIVTEENVLTQLDHLATYPCVAAGLAKGNLVLHGWYYEIPSGAIYCYDGSTGDFDRFQGVLPTASARFPWRGSGEAA